MLVIGWYWHVFPHISLKFQFNKKTVEHIQLMKELRHIWITNVSKITFTLLQHTLIGGRQSTSGRGKSICKYMYTRKNTHIYILHIIIHDLNLNIYLEKWWRILYNLSAVYKGDNRGLYGSGKHCPYLKQKDQIYFSVCEDMNFTLYERL